MLDPFRGGMAVKLCLGFSVHLHQDGWHCQSELQNLFIDKHQDVLEEVASGLFTLCCKNMSVITPHVPVLIPPVLI